MSDDFDPLDAIDEPVDDDGPSTGILDRDSATVNIGGRQYVVGNIHFETIPAEEESVQPLTFSQSPFLEIITAHFQPIQAPMAHSAQEPATDDRHPSEIPVVETEFGQSSEAQEVRRQVTRQMELASELRDAQALSDEQLQMVHNTLSQFIDARQAGLGAQEVSAVPFPALGTQPAEDRRRAMRVSSLAEDALAEAEEAIQDLRFVVSNETLRDAGDPAVEDVLADLGEIVNDLSALRDRIATDPELFPQQPKVTNPVTDTGPVSAARFSGLVDEREEDA